MYHQQSRGRGRGRGFRGAPRGHGVHHNQGRGGWGGGGRASIPPYQVALPTEPHPRNAVWLEKVADAWRQGGSGSDSELSVVLWDAFSSTDQPYLRMLDLVVFSPDYSRNRPDGLTAYVLQTFGSWLEQNYGGVQKVRQSMINDKVRQLAFKATGGQECSYISDAIVELCDLTGAAHMFVDEVYNILQAKDYKKACQLATRLKLHSQFGVEEFVMPLVLLDRANVAELFLAESPDLQKTAVSAVDDVLERSLPMAASMLGMPTFAKDSVNQKTLKKLIERWCKRFGLEVRSAAPKSALFSARATMNYLFYRRFKEDSIKPDDCEDFLVEILADYPELIPDALDRLAREGAHRTLLNAALTLGVPARELPLGLTNLYLRQQEVVDEDRDRCSSPRSPDDFYRMPEYVRVELVDRADQLPSIVRDLEMYDGPLGLDAEWKPISVRDVNTVSLLQVAAEEVVYVFDLIQLAKSTPMMEQLGMAVLCGNNLKLGFDVASDFDMLEASVPSFGKAIMSRKNMMDIKILGNRVETAFPKVFPFKEAPPPRPQDGAAAGRRKPKDVAKGLSALVRKCAGRPLDKAEQCSNWNRRPLRQSQLQYAATDAFCLVAVFAVLQERLQQQESTTPQDVLRCIVTSGAGRTAAAPGHGKHKKAAPAPPRVSQRRAQGTAHL